MKYRRVYESGRRYFFTLVTHRRQPLLTVDSNIHRLRSAFRIVRSRLPFEIDAIVILPDHLHTVWRLPEADVDYSKRWSLIKRRFSAGCTGLQERGLSASRAAKRERPVWQRRFWEHTIRDEEDWARHLDYIHYNPVRHGLVRQVVDWPHSSFKRCVERGWYEAGWGGSEPERIRGMDVE